MKLDAIATEIPLRDLVDADQEPTISQWSVAGHDRVIGKVYGRQGSVDGNTIITSPVLQVRIVGESATALAITASGSTYRLGEPAASFGHDRAAQFVASKSCASGDGAPRDPSLHTGLMKLPD